MPGESQAAGKKQGRGGLIPGTIFVVAYQGKATAGKLYPDLMATAGMQTDTHQIVPVSDKFQPGFLNALSFFFDHEDFVFAAVLEQKVCPVSIFRG